MSEHFTFKQASKSFDIELVEFNKWLRLLDWVVPGHRKYVVPSSFALDNGYLTMVDWISDNGSTRKYPVVTIKGLFELRKLMKEMQQESE